MPEITARDNPQIKAAVLLRESAKARRAQGRFFLEGPRLCADAIASGYEPEVLFVTEAAFEKYGLEGTRISRAVADKLADTQNPQGVFGVFRMREGTVFWRPGGRYAALDNIQNPDNLGAVARTAEALGFQGLLVRGGCDVFHPKALRAGMGALLRLPVEQTEDLPGALRGCGLPVYASVPEPGARPVTACDFTGGGVMVIGNEGGGISPEALAACGHSVTIPMPGRAQSLNAAAAAAVLLWEMQRQDLGGGRVQASGYRGAKTSALLIVN